MPYIAKDATSTFIDQAYKNAKGNTECAHFVQQVTGAPSTSAWKKGVQVKGAAAGTITPGTAIATFDENDKYPTDSLGRHAAVYVSHSPEGITVVDQWNAQGKVKQRTIRYGKPGSRSNNGDTFYVIE